CPLPAFGGSLPPSLRSGGQSSGGQSFEEHKGDKLPTSDFRLPTHHSPLTTHHSPPPTSTLTGMGSRHQVRLLILSVAVVTTSTLPVFLTGAAFFQIGPELGIGPFGLGAMTAAFFL